MASIYVDSRDTHVEVRWSPRIERVMVAIGDGSMHLSVAEAQQVLTDLTAALAQAGRAAA